MKNDQAWIDEAAARIADAVRLALSIKQGMEAQLRQAIRTALAELDLASKEEVQELEAMLARAREQLDRLEARVAALEDAAPSKKDDAAER